VQTFDAAGPVEPGREGLPVVEAYGSLWIAAPQSPIVARVKQPSGS
jgi:hypothetical protein